MRFQCCLLALLLLCPGGLWGQGVTVAPHHVFIDHQLRSGSILLYNANAAPAEVTISAIYGYPVTDSTGRMLLHVVDAADSSVPSAARWIQAFPRRLTIGPLQRQTVRLLVTPPPGLVDGEYWARLVISAKEGTAPVAGISDSAGIQVGLSLEVRTVIPFVYRKGLLATSVALSRLRAEVVGDSLEVWERLERRGNAAFLGTVRGVLVDSTGKARTEFTSPLSVYYSLEPRFATSIAGVPPGRYWLRMSISTEREDLSPKVVFQAPTIRDSVEVTLR